MPRIDRLKQLHARISRAPESAVNMGIWLSNCYGGWETEAMDCGTTGCLWGHALFEFPDDLYFTSLGWIHVRGCSGSLVTHHAAYFFDLPFSEASNLIDGDARNPDGSLRLDGDGQTQIATKSEALWRLQRLIDGLPIYEAEPQMS